MTETHSTDHTDPLQMFTVPEVAKLLKVSERHVYREIDADRLAAHHIGRSLRILRADLMAYVKASKDKKDPPG